MESAKPRVVTTQEQHRRGIQLFEQGLYAQAAQIFSELVTVEDSSEMWNDWAAAQAAAGQIEQAKCGFERAMQLDPSNEEAAANLAELVRQYKGRGAPVLAEKGHEIQISAEQKLRNWSFETKRQLLFALIGFDFGMEPETRLDEIRAYKQKESGFLVRSLQLTQEDVLLDLGSGCGFITRVMAPLCKRVHCVDISQEFLRFAQEELQELHNIEFHRMEYGNLHCLDGKQISKGYSNAVFIHFNFFDIVIYLREIHRILREDGIFLFGMNNTDCLDIHNDRYFGMILEHYMRDRSRPTLMQWNSAQGVCAIARQIGFEAHELWAGQGTAMILLHKPPS